MQNISIMPKTVAMISAERPSSATYRLLTATALTAAVSGQNGIQRYIVSAVAPAPDGGEVDNQKKTCRQIGGGESRQDRYGEPPERRALHVAQQDEARERILRFVQLGAGQGADQIARRY